MIRRLIVTLCCLTCLSNCAFYEKRFISRVVLQGINYGERSGDEGVFYIDDEPLIRMELGCGKTTTLGSTAFLLIPLPILFEDEPHDSIGEEYFSLTLSHLQSSAPALQNLPIELSTNSGNFPLENISREEIEYHVDYTYSSKVRCDELVDATLLIQLAELKERVYKLQFEESISRRVSYQANFVT